MILIGVSGSFGMACWPLSKQTAKGGKVGDFVALLNTMKSNTVHDFMCTDDVQHIKIEVPFNENFKN